MQIQTPNLCTAWVIVKLQFSEANNNTKRVNLTSTWPKGTSQTAHNYSDKYMRRFWMPYYCNFRTLGSKEKTTYIFTVLYTAYTIYLAHTENPVSNKKLRIELFHLSELPMSREIGIHWKTSAKYFFLHRSCIVQLFYCWVGDVKWEQVGERDTKLLRESLRKK